MLGSPHIFRKCKHLGPLPQYAESSAARSMQIGMMNAVATIAVCRRAGRKTSGTGGSHRYCIRDPKVASLPEEDQQDANPDRMGFPAPFW